MPLLDVGAADVREKAELSTHTVDHRLVDQVPASVR